ncbi:MULTISPECIES: ABC transporter permease [Amycolatopsis]|uniref:ABC-2 type transport system permease protein n=2 Tax=Amycolatopsis TaxID=1813 RepID=A0A1I3S3A9_9PSEU|nr:ABC transporter permease [Amycolatopsis sacchari]SFJ52562.1 ABC-2 type transport system permease protein [Amycolatopsis sacchari]
MTLLAVERIKLFTTRSPWWCALIALVITIGFSALVVGNSGDEFPATVASTQFGYSFGMAVIMVLAALSVTTEYRFGTIRTTFQAVPHRASALLAKTTVVALLALVIGEISAFGSWAIGTVLKPNADLALDSGADWINVAGVGVVYALAAVIAVAVGILLRHSAGAIALLLIYMLAVESLVRLIPSIGDDIYEWMPFNVANKFLTGSGGANAGRDAAAGAPLSTSPLDQGWALVYFAGVAAVLLIIAISTAKRRDA